MPFLLPEPLQVFPSLPVKSLDPFKGSGVGKLYFRLIGPNGSGKSAFGRLLQANDPEAFAFLGEGGKPIGTVFPNLGWGTVGKYTNRCGGGDSLTETPRIMEAIYRLCETHLHLFLEGLAVSSASERYWQIDLGVQQNFGRKGLLVYLDYPPEECIRRVYVRNGNKPFKEHYVTEKHRWILNAIHRYEARIAAGAPVRLERESTAGVRAMLDSLLSRLETVYGAKVLP